MNELMGPIISCLFVKILEIHVVKIVLVVLEENVFCNRRTETDNGRLRTSTDDDRQ